MYISHYRIAAPNFEYGGKFLSETDDLRVVIPEIVCIENDDIDASMREFQEAGRYEFDCGERAVTAVRIRLVPKEDARVLVKYL